MAEPRPDTLPNAGAGKRPGTGLSQSDCKTVYAAGREGPRAREGSLA
jgi:hypothetical protein